MAIITLKGMDFYSFHGHFEEEKLIGTHFEVDLIIETDTGTAEISDRLEDTLDYQSLYNLVKAEMEKDSKLLEHVARRIIDSVSLAFPEIIKAEVTVAKLNPPLGGKIKSVCITLVKG